MAKATSQRKAEKSGRGSKEAIAKRRAARQLNALFADGSRSGRTLDGRTEKRRRRLLKELKEGRGGKPLKAIEILSHGHELLELGESIASIRKSGVKLPKTHLNPEDFEIIEQTQTEYQFREDAWKLLGVDLPKSRSNGRRNAKKATSKS